jgi:hypothetical protein
MSSVRSAWFRIEIKDKNNQWQDVTDNVAGRIELEETAELLDKLSFTLVSTDEQSVMRFMDGLAQGDEVSFWLGYVDGIRFLNDSNEMFSGRIGKLLPQFSATGRPSLKVIVYDPGWLLTKSKPSMPRTFGTKQGAKQMTREDIVKFVCQPYLDNKSLSSVVVKIPSKYSGVASNGKGEVIQQNQGENDWKFLKRLAHGDNKEYNSKFNGCDCVVYVQTVNNKPILFFVPEEDLTSVTSSIGLVYPMEGTEIIVDQDPTSVSGKMIMDAEIDDNPDIQADEPLIEVPADAFTNDDELKNEILQNGGTVPMTMEEFYDSFTINTDLIQQDENSNTGIAKTSLMSQAMGMYDGSFSWKDVSKYVTYVCAVKPAGKTSTQTDVPSIIKDDLKDPIRARENIQNALNRAIKKRKSAGIVMTASLIEGNFNIRPRMVYSVENLGGKYSSSDKIRWFAETVTHTIDGNKYTQKVKLTL